MIYTKIYIAVLDEVPNHMVPVLVAHSMLGAHLFFEQLQDNTLYKSWLSDSFRKCVVKVNRKEFDKIKELPFTYLCHENTTLNGEKSCAVCYPTQSDNIPNVLKFSKLWSPN